jgi:hypothetical protein
MFHSNEAGPSRFVADLRGSKFISKAKVASVLD